MDGSKILEVVTRYRAVFERAGIGKEDYPHEELLRSSTAGLRHCHGMLDKIERFVDQGRIEKSFRWLGFVQACLWMSGRFSISDLANHSRPDPPEG